jgi:serine/threonine protein kinase
VLPRRYASPVLVAHGGMGQVYRATDSALERTVAVKLLADRYAGDDDARARFRREGLAAARLSAAPNVVTVFDVAEHHGRPLIVMEYLEGGSVYEQLRHGRVSREQALLWLGQAASALDEAHAHGVVHRDVKPANLLLDREGNVHVSDFGIASATGADTLTTPGMVLGTAGYLSPEQARGEAATAASDRYALGVVAFELLTGRRPFAGDTPTTEAFAHLHADVPSATSLDPALPSAVDAVFASALAKDPSARPASARELVERLRDTLAGDVRLAPPTLVSPNVPTRVRTSAPTRRLVHRTRRRLAPLAALATVGVLVLGLLVGVLLDSGDDLGDRAAQATARAGTSAASAETTSTTPTPNGVALNARGFARMQSGDYDGALPLLRGAVLALAGTGSLTEAYADYNLASSRFAVGRCEGVVGLLDRSERIQGARREIDELRSRWQLRCAPADNAEDRGEDRPGKHGKGKGKGHD